MSSLMLHCLPEKINCSEPVLLPATLTKQLHALRSKWPNVSVDEIVAHAVKVFLQKVQEPGTCVRERLAAAQKDSYESAQ